MFEGFKQATYRCNGIDIHATVGGNGPPVLLLHGFPQTHAMWAKVAPILAKNYTVVCSDIRGYGSSGKPPANNDLSNYSFREMAKDQLELMQQLGFNQFHMIGHDRGARVTHRLSLDHPEALLSVSLLDIIPLHDVFSKVDRHIAKAYWHWYFLQQPAPYPEDVILANPDKFYEGCLFGWGSASLENFDFEQLAAYRQAWRQKDTIYGSCADYRAAASVDFSMDEQDLNKQVAVPALVLWGANGIMGKLFSMQDAWSRIYPNLVTESIPGGHFFVDQFPVETANKLLNFLETSQQIQKTLSQKP